MANSAYDAFVEAYNNFDYRPLKGEGLRKFYVDDFTKGTVKSIKTTVKITERYKKILVIGHTGCGKSTILNKAAEELENDYHIVNFSVAKELNMMDIDTIDILTVLYFQLVEYARKRGIQQPSQPLKDLIELVKDRINLSAEAGVQLWDTLSFKIKVEPESREAIRKEFKTRLETLQNNISQVCKTISQTPAFMLTQQSFNALQNGTVSPSENMLHALRPLQNKEYAQEEEFTEALVQHTGSKTQVDRYKGLILKHARTEKDVLIIIDDLDKLKNEFAQKVFFDETDLLTMLDAKIIFTFPLANYYSAAFSQISERFKAEYIKLVNLYTPDGTYQQMSLEMLKKLVLKRIDPKYISDEAMKYLIDHSGGLLRHVIGFMQDACNYALLEDKVVERIDEHSDIPQKVIQDKINEFKGMFDFPHYESDVRKISETPERPEVEHEHLNYLLRFLFVLEYGRRGKGSWYLVHPCLQALLE